MAYSPRHGADVVHLDDARRRRASRTARAETTHSILRDLGIEDPFKQISVDELAADLERAFYDHPAGKGVDRG